MLFKRLVGVAGIAVSAMGAQAAPVEWSPGSGGNGHSYEIVIGSLSWTEARDAAATGGGYLATVTSAAEQDFLDALYMPRSVYNDGDFQFATLWLGGSDAEEEGVWRWVVGPESGQLISAGYTNWAPSEPNEFIEGEDYLGGWYRVDNGSQWNDLPNMLGQELRGYVVEYSPDPDVIPLPATLPLLAAGVVAIGLARRRDAKLDPSSSKPTL